MVWLGINVGINIDAGVIRLSSSSSSLVLTLMAVNAGIRRKKNVQLLVGHIGVGEGGAIVE